MTTYYVRKTGSDAADGLSPATAWLTIDYAASTVAAGDTVYIGSGVYRESVTMDTAGTSGNVISYIGDVDGTQTGDPGLAIISAHDSPGQDFARQFCVDLNDGKKFLTFKYLIFEGNGNTGAPVFDGTATDNSYEAVTFDGCVFLPTNPSQRAAFWIDYNNGATPAGALGLTIKNCALMGTILIDTINNAAAHVNAKAVIANNLIITNNSYAVRNAPASGANSYSVGGFAIANNTIVGAVTISFNSAKNTTNPITIYNNVWLIGGTNLVDGFSAAASAVFEDNNLGFLCNGATVVSGTVTSGGHSLMSYVAGALFGGFADWPLYQALGWSPYKPWEPIVPTNALEWGDTTYAPTTDAYSNPRSMGRHLVYCRMDGSDAAVSDPGAKWSSDANVTDNDVLDTATCTTQGDTTTNYLMAEGTNYPASGATVTQVRGRFKGFVQNSNNRLDVAITSDAAAETLATITNTTEDVATWTAWTTLTVPSGGWTPAKVQALEFKAFKQDSNAGTVTLYYIELEVTQTANVDAGAVEARVRPVQEGTITNSGAASVEFAGAGYHDMLVPVDATSTVISVASYRDASYTGDNPILEVLDVPGYADQSDAQTGDAAEWEQLSCTIVPTAAGWCRVRLRSRDTSAVGKCYFDDVAVA